MSNYLPTPLSLCVPEGATVGQVEYHSHRVYLAPLSAIWTGVLILAATYVWPVGGFWDVGTWWLAAFSLLLGCHVLQLLRLVPGSAFQKLPQPHYNRRRLAYLGYVHRLVNWCAVGEAAPPSDSLRGVVEKAKASGWSTNVMSYHKSEARRKAAIESHSPLKELHAIWCAVSSGNDDVDAFFYPTRLTAALVVSLFATVLLALSLRRTLLHVRDVIRQLDAQTIEAASGAVRRLCALYTEQTGEEMPGEGIEWSNAQIERLHDHMVSLSDAVYLAFSGAPPSPLSFTCGRGWC